MIRQLLHPIRLRVTACTTHAPGRARLIARLPGVSALRLALLAVILSLALPLPARAAVQRIAALNATIDWDTGDVSVTARVPAARGKSEAALKASALNQARENMKTLLDRVSEGGSGAYDIPGKADKARVVALVASGRITNARKVGSSYELTLCVTLTRIAVGGGDDPLPEARVPVYAEPDTTKVRTFPAPPATGEETLLTPNDAKGPFTGIVVDARGLGVRSGMSPEILDAAMREVYSGAHIPIDVVEDIGVASFTPSVAAALKLTRVGRRPLVLRAVGAAEPNGIRPIISLEDAKRLLADLGVPEIIKKGAVCIVIGDCPPAPSTTTGGQDAPK